MHLLLTPVVAFVEHTRGGVTQLAQEHVGTPLIKVIDEETLGCLAACRAGVGQLRDVDGLSLRGAGGVVDEAGGAAVAVEAAKLGRVASCAVLRVPSAPSWRQQVRSPSQLSLPLPCDPWPRLAASTQRIRRAQHTATQKTASAYLRLQWPAICLVLVLELFSRGQAVLVLF